MISDDSIKAVINFADLYSKKGYKKELVHDEKTNKYELSLTKNDATVIIRDGCFNGKFDKHLTELTSFDVLFRLDDIVFAKYFSDYPLDEYEECLRTAFRLIDSFFKGDYSITSEEWFVFRKRKYLNIIVGGESEHLLGKNADLKF